MIRESRALEPGSGVLRTVAARTIPLSLPVVVRTAHRMRKTVTRGSAVRMSLLAASASGWRAAEPDGDPGLEELSTVETNFFSAVGDPARIRSVREPASCSLRNGYPHTACERQGINLVIVWENSEGQYSEVGGRFARGTIREFATQVAIFTCASVTRIAEYVARVASWR